MVRHHLRGVLHRHISPRPAVRCRSYRPQFSMARVHVARQRQSARSSGRVSPTSQPDTDIDFLYRARVGEELKEAGKQGPHDLKACVVSSENDSDPRRPPPSFPLCRRSATVHHARQHPVLRATSGGGLVASAPCSQP